MEWGEWIWWGRGREDSGRPEAPPSMGRGCLSLVWAGRQAVLRGRKDPLGTGLGLGQEPEGRPAAATLTGKGAGASSTSQ